MEKLKQLLDKDEQIIQLQGEIVESAFSQVKNGVITSTDYLSELNSRVMFRANQTSLHSHPTQ